MAAFLEPQLLFSNPIFASKASNTTDPHHIHNLKLKLPNFPSKNSALVFNLNSSASFATCNNTVTTPCCVASNPSPSLPPDDPNPNPVAVTAPERTREGRDRRKIVKVAWEKLVRWSRSWRSKTKTDVLERTNKVLLENN